MITCQYSKSLLFNRGALFPQILQSPLIHWPFPWKHSSPVTLTDEQHDPLTSNLFMLMVLTLFIVSEAPHSCLLSSVELYFPEILSISSLYGSITFPPPSTNCHFFFLLTVFQNLQTLSHPPLPFIGLSFSYLHSVHPRGSFSVERNTFLDWISSSVGWEIVHQ